MREEFTISFTIQSDEENQRIDLRAFRNGGKRLVFEGTIYAEELTVGNISASKEDRISCAEELAKEIMQAIIVEGM
ncbi:MAG: hypothetical protein ACREBS_07220 [Nitrososphaerales archaeon]